MSRTKSSDNSSQQDVTEIGGMEEQDFDLLTMYFMKESEIGVAADAASVAIFCWLLFLLYYVMLAIR